ncbi:MAG: hypothetical protein ACO1OC_02760 [Tuberibacillus sp.]
MVINNGGNLSKEYFVAYFLLIMDSRQVTLDKAKEIAFERLFRSDEKTLGAISFQHFIEAYEGLMKNESLM